MVGFAPSDRSFCSGFGVAVEFLEDLKIYDAEQRLPTPRGRGGSAKGTGKSPGLWFVLSYLVVGF